MIPRYVALALLLTTGLPALARDKQENWIQVTSPHFVVATDGSDKQGRQVADQFERMRSVFHTALPKLNMDSGGPIIVIAVKGEKDFRTLEPEDYLSKGSLKLGGLFLRTADKNYVLMRLDAEGDHPYAVIYHEYTHFLFGRGSTSMPLWLNEGLAEFYQNTEIREKEALLGEPSADDVLWLRQNRLLPLETLLAVDQKSPYYHEEKKGSIFYAESWALTHFIYITDFPQNAHRLNDYLALVAQNVDPVTAATRVFGDLKQLQSQLEHYVQQSSFHYIPPIKTTSEMDESAFRLQALSPGGSEALRADFLAYEGRIKDSQALLDHVLGEDSKNVPALETRGYIAFRQGHLEEAKKWYGEAVQLDSQSYLAHYYFAAMSINSGGGPSQPDQVESSLRTAIKLNPSYAPAYDMLAAFLGMQNKNLDEARMMALTAISLDPGNIRYRINVANLLLTMEKSQDAVQVLGVAVKLAKTEEETQMAVDALTRAQEYADEHAKFAESQRQYAAEPDDDANENLSEKPDGAIPTLERPPEFVPKGPHRFAVGVLKSVTCENPSLDLTVSSKGKDLPLHVDNYYKIPFSALGFEPSEELNPCTDLENKPAKVEYVESANPSVAAQIISVELHK
jgi:tetratricopeptide (TPR) repeat protein